jgi:hypothetical protein
MNVERLNFSPSMTAPPAILRPLLPALGAALLALAPQAHGLPEQWGSAGVGINPTGLIIQDGEHLVYIDTVYNYGTCDADNLVSLSRFAVTGAVTVVTDTNAAPARFYRAVVP